MKWSAELAIGILGIGVSLGACRREVTLIGAAGTPQLVYDCRAFQQRAATGEEQNVVMEYAVRIVRAAADGDAMDSVMPLVAAVDSGAYERLEMLVVKHLCAGGAVATHPGESEEPDEFPASGSVAPSFALPLISKDGLTDSTIRLDDHLGQYVLLYFWSTWCKPCRGKHPEMVAMHEAFSTRGIAIYGLLFRDRPSAAAAWLRQDGVYPVLFDEARMASQSYRILGVPWMFLIDREGRLMSQCVGCQTGPWHPDSLRHRLDSLLGSG